MTSRNTRDTNQSCIDSEPEQISSLEEIVDDYIVRWRPDDEKEAKSWKGHSCLGDAVRRAALSIDENGKRHPHQYRIPKQALERAAEVLEGIDFSVMTSFEELHQTIEHLIKSPNIKGIGELAVYDMAHRIGMYLDLLPEFVYLHRGTRDGAYALGFEGDKLHKNQLPKALQKLTPAEIENCLCIYKLSIKNFRDCV